MVIVIAFAECANGHNHAVAGRVFSGIRTFADCVAEGVNKECGMLHHHHAEHTGNQESAKGALPDGNIGEEVIVKSAKHRGADNTDKKGNPLHIAVLPHHQFFLQQVIDVLSGVLGAELEHQPADMSPEKTLGNVVGIFIVIDVLVMRAVVRTPIEARIFKCTSPENKRKKFHWPFCLEGQMGKKTVITKRNAHRSGWHHKGEHRPLKPRLFE